MKFIIFAIITSIGFVYSAQAKLISRPHFYEITKGSETHYLLGTLHHVVKLSDLPPVVHKSFKKSKSLITEVHFKDSLKDGIWKKLDELKSSPLPKLKDGHVEKLRRLGVSDKLLPRSDSDSADIYIFFPFSGNYPFYMMDVDIYFKAKASSKKLFKLDSDEIIKESKKFGKSHTSGQTIGDVLDTMSEHEIHSWGKNSIERYLAGPKENKKESSDGGIIFRNKQWLPKILRYYKENNLTFMAVGAAHLYGNNGLIQLLKTNGYKVELKGTN